MSIRAVGLLMTSLAVLVLLGSMVAGLAGERPADPTALAASGIVGEAPPADAVAVEVLNGAGVPGLAREVTERLRRLDFDVKYYGNAAGDSRDSTVILIRRGSGDAARRVAEALSIDRVEAAPDTTLYLDATIILGRDLASP